MMKALKKVNWKKLGIFAGGVLFGTAGIKVLSSKDAKNVYTHCTAGVLRAKDCVMKTANTIQSYTSMNLHYSQTSNFENPACNWYVNPHLCYTFLYNKYQHISF